QVLARRDRIARDVPGDSCAVAFSAENRKSTFPENAPMTSIVLALAASVCFGAGLVLTQLGLRYVPPLNGAAISIQSSLVLLICVAPFALAGVAVHWDAVPIFAAAGLLYPGAATLMTFAANRALGPGLT